MLVKLMSCLCRRVRVVCSSSVSSAGVCPSVCLVVLVKGTSLCFTAISPPLHQLFYLLGVLCIQEI